MDTSIAHQYDLFNPVEEANLYHQPGNYGFFSILSHTPGREKKDQASYRLPLLAEVLRLLPKDRDTWLSQAEFVKPNRRIIYLARIGLLFADIDCYKPGINIEPERALQGILWACEDSGLPPPSISIHSGRGLQLKWLLDKPLPRWALPRWNAAQSSLVGRFEAWGADHGAKDASRVLRLVSTVNTRSGEIVRVMHTTDGRDGLPVRYDFEWLCEWLFIHEQSRDEYDKKKQNHPYTQEQQDAIAKAREAREAKRSQIKLVPGGGAVAVAGGLHRFSGRQLAWHRMEDIRSLVKIRGGVQAGQSMTTLFWSLNFLLLSGATNSNQMYYEAAALAREFGFGEFNRPDELKTLYRKAVETEAGKTVTFQGREYPALYTPKNNILIEQLGITDDEQHQLKTIISVDVAAERHRLRDETARRARGEATRDEYLSSNNDKRSRARLMRSQGHSLGYIAAEMGIPRPTIQTWCRGV